jgi:hypothetical protein
LVGEPIIDGVHFHTGRDPAWPAGATVVSVTAGPDRVTTRRQPRAKNNSRQLRLLIRLSKRRVGHRCP